MNGRWPSQADMSVLPDNQAAPSRDAGYDGGIERRLLARRGFGGRFPRGQTAGLNALSLALLRPAGTGRPTADPSHRGG